MVTAALMAEAVGKLRCRPGGGSDGECDFARRRRKVVNIVGPVYSRIDDRRDGHRQKQRAKGYQQSEHRSAPFRPSRGLRRR